MKNMQNIIVTLMVLISMSEQEIRAIKHTVTGKSSSLHHQTIRTPGAAPKSLLQITDVRLAELGQEEISYTTALGNIQTQRERYNRELTALNKSPETAENLLAKHIYLSAQINAIDQQTKFFEQLNTARKALGKVALSAPSDGVELEKQNYTAKKAALEAKISAAIDSAIGTINNDTAAAKRKLEALNNLWAFMQASPIGNINIPSIDQDISMLSKMLKILTQNSNTSSAEPDERIAIISYLLALNAAKSE